MKKFLENSVAYLIVFGLIIWTIGISDFIRGAAILFALWIVIEIIADRVVKKLREQ